MEMNKLDQSAINFISNANLIFVSNEIENGDLESPKFRE